MLSSAPDNSKPPRRIAIQGERGSNSHMAALAMLGEVEIIPCNASPRGLRIYRPKSSKPHRSRGCRGSAYREQPAWLRSPAYDLLLEHPVRIAGESLLRIRHNLIAAPGVRLEAGPTSLSHPVALAVPQLANCIPPGEVCPVLRHRAASSTSDGRSHDTAGIAPVLAAKVYGANVLVAGIEAHARTSPASTSSSVKATRSRDLCSAGQDRVWPSLSSTTPELWSEPWRL